MKIFINKKVFLPVLIFVSISIGFVLGRFVYKSQNIFYSFNKDFKRLKILIDIAEENYDGKINVFEIMQDALLNKLHEIDPYFSFYDAENFETFMNDLSGEFTGYGIRYTLFKDTIVVIDVMENSPAFKAGIKKLDQIIELDGNSIVSSNIDSLVEFFKSKESLKFTVKNFFNQKLNAVTIKKDIVKLNSVTYFYAGNSTAYFKIDAFNSNTYDYFKAAEDKLLSKNEIYYLILDLRDNPGGLLSSAVKILNEFYEKDEVIVITKSNSKEEKVYKADGKGKFKDVKIIVLVNENTASASELVCLSFQDNDRALVLGTKTYGKGVFQEDLPVKQGDYIHVTTGKYLGPSGRWIDAYANEKISYFKTKNGRYVAGNSAISPDFVFYSNYVAGIEEYLTNFSLNIISNNKVFFSDVQNPEIIYQNGEKLFLSYEDDLSFVNDSDKLILYKTITYSLSQFLFDKSVYEKYYIESDSCFIKAMEFFDNKDLFEKYMNIDTIKPIE